MQPVKNERGAVIVFVTLMIVILMIMVGLGLDTGQLTYVRNQGQSAVDAAALSAISALPSRVDSEVKSRAAAYIGANTYVEGATNKIGGSHVSYVQYDFTTNQITNYSATVANANGVRVALEGGNSITTPVFLTPLLNLLGHSASATKNINVSAVSVMTAKASIPIALWQQVCDGNPPGTKVNIYQQPPGEENSCWTCYLDNSCGAIDVKTLFQDASTCAVNSATAGVDVGVSIYENKGEAASVYDVAKTFFFTDYPGREWLIPVIAGAGNCNSKNPTPIVDWAKIKVTGIHKQGAHSYIEAHVTCNQSLKTSTDSLCFSNRLVREPTKGY